MSGLVDFLPIALLWVLPALIIAAAVAFVVSVARASDDD